MVERLVERVRECDFVAAVGSLGCGKSSLVRAGLVTALHEGALPSSGEWAIRIFRPAQIFCERSARRSSKCWSQRPLGLRVWLRPATWLISCVVESYL